MSDNILVIRFKEQAMRETLRATPCDHDWQARYDHRRCCKCGAVATDSGWGIAKFMEFKSHDEAKFYQQHGRRPE